MRTHLFRGVFVAVIAVVMAAPAFAQSIVKGTVVDQAGKPVANAVVLFEAVEAAARRVETKTNNKGEFLQVGVPSGNYKVTATAGNLKQQLTMNVRQGENRPLAFQLTPASGLSEEDKKAQAAMATAASEAIAAMQAGNFDVAIPKFEEIVVKVPTCSDCFYNLGLAYTSKQNYDKAEASFKRVLEINPNSSEAYSGLANLYNAQKKFDLAVQMSQKAAEVGAANGGGGASAEAMFNQGVTLWNAQKYTEAKVQFEAATKADPKMSSAWYQLGMANVNLGQLAEAKAAFQGYLANDPMGPKAAEVQGILKALP